VFRVRLTNDDGIIAPGIRTLARQLARWCSVTVVAPNRPRSATSHSITLHKPLRLASATRDCEEYDHENIAAYSCSGTPSDCVMLGILHLHASNPLDLVISGINDGMNVAEDLTYSGTVGGALEGAILGVPSMAASLAGHRRISFGQAAELMDAIISYLVHGSIPDVLASHHVTLGLPAEGPADRTESNGGGRTPGWVPAGLSGQLCLNVNIPDLAPEKIQGLKWTRAGSRMYEDVVRISRDPNGREYYWLGGTKVLDHELPDSDTQAISAGWVSITPVTYDITQQRDLNKLESWYTERYSGRGGQNRHDE
jgi:5'-nucleotidase